MITPDQWIELAPKPRELADGQHWHVFLSYRSVHRPWVIQLYDVLRHLGFEVFLDQYVLKPANPLVKSLAEGLDKSATGVIVWSSEYDDSEWCQAEYESMETRALGDKKFKFVVTTLDETNLPAFARRKLFIDFSEFREGPRGSGLLRLLYGLIDEALPDPVVRLATTVDEETRDTMAEIRGLAQIGDGDGLLALADRETAAWMTSPLLGSLVADKLISLKENDKALAVIEKQRARFPKAIRPRQLQGLALARKGELPAAQQILSKLYEEGERDPETVGIYARTWKDRYAKSNNPLHLEKARDLYAEAFRDTPGDYYTGINAASTSALLGEPDAASEYAAKVEQIVGTEKVVGDYWRTATVAEVQLLRQNYEQAAKLYRDAVRVSPDAVGSHESTWKQAQILMDKLGTPPEERAKVAAAFSHLKS